MNRIALFTLIAIIGFATSAMADSITVTEVDPLNAPSRPLSVTSPPTGSYFIAPGISDGGAFAFAGGPFTDSIINGATEVIGPDLGGGTIESTDVLTNGGSTLIITITSTSGDLAPAVAGPGGAPFTTLGLFIGATAGGTPIDFGGEIVQAATVELFSGGVSATGGGIDIFSAATQAGSLGLTFGAGSAGLGIDTAVITYDFVVVPEPNSIAILSIMGLGLVTRRRR